MLVWELLSTPGTTPATSVAMPQELFLVRLGRANTSSNPTRGPLQGVLLHPVRQQDLGSQLQGGTR